MYSTTFYAIYSRNSYWNKQMVNVILNHKMMKSITGMIMTSTLFLFLTYTLSEPAYSSTVDNNGIVQQDLQQQQQQPNLSASSVYQTKTMVLGNDIKNLIILIPNEGHEPSPDYSQPPPEELRVINQPYIPENVVVNVGTTVTMLATLI